MRFLRDSAQEPSENVIERDISPELLIAEETLKKLCEPQASREDTVGDVIWDDIDRWMNGPGAILNDLLNRLRESRAEDGAYLTQTYWPAARASRSVAARIVLLGVLLEGDEIAGDGHVIDEIITDGRLYHFLDAFSSLWRAIRQRWPALSVAVRADVIENIRRISHSPLLNGVYAVGPLLDAVPVEDRPDDLKLFLEIYRLRGRDPTPKPRQRTTLVRPPDAADRGDVFDAAWSGLDEIWMRFVA